MNLGSYNAQVANLAVIVDEALVAKFIHVSYLRTGNITTCLKHIKVTNDHFAGNWLSVCILSSYFIDNSHFFLNYVILSKTYFSSSGVNESCWVYNTAIAKCDLALEISRVGDNYTWTFGGHSLLLRCAHL